MMEQADVEQRVTRLEAHFEYIRADLDEIKAEQRWLGQKLEAHQRSVGEKLEALTSILGDIRIELAKRPTTGQFWGMIGAVAAISLATIAIIITGIIGGLAWLQAAP